MHITILDFVIKNNLCICSCFNMILATQERVFGNTMLQGVLNETGHYYPNLINRKIVAETGLFKATQ